MKNIFVKTLMLKGQAGGTIDKIEKTGTSGIVDTYTVTYNDGETSTFEVTNGNGIVSIEHTSSSGYYDTYTITFTDGSTDTFTVKNGEDGAGYEVPTGSVLYFDSSDAVPEGYEESSNPDASTLTDLQDKAEKASGLTWFHDLGVNTLSMSGALSAVGAWISSNFVSNKWIGCKVLPTDNTGYFGSSSFSVLANCSSANYGVVQLMSDNPNKSALVIGQLVGGVWSWKTVSTTDIS